VYGYNLPSGNDGLSGSGGRGGSGGDGLQASGSTTINISADSKIYGGSGGIGADGADNGAAGAGIRSEALFGGVTVINSGLIQAGVDGGGVLGTAIVFVNGSNRLEIRAGSQIVGNVVSFGNQGRADTLAVGGELNAGFDLSAIGAQYQGFGLFEKSGGSTWTLSGTPTSFTGDLHANGGTLAFAGGAKLTTVNGYVGYDSGANANVTVSGASTSWFNTSLFVGYRGNGALLIADGGRVTAVTALIGNDASYAASGSVTVDGAGSVLDTQKLQIGVASVGALTVRNGGTAKARSINVGATGVSGALNIGAEPGAAPMAPGTIIGQVALAQSGTLNFNHTAAATFSTS
jgi:fibronectin-binding autotransporter adhesin